MGSLQSAVNVTNGQFRVALTALWSSRRAYEQWQEQVHTLTLRGVGGLQTEKAEKLLQEHRVHRRPEASAVHHFHH